MKRVSVNFWMIFGKNENGGDESSPQPCPVSAEFLKKLQGKQVKLFVYANEGPEPAKVEGRVPEFQLEIVKSLMESRLDKAGVPYDEVSIERPFAEVHVNRNITQHENWESLLLNKLRK